MESDFEALGRCAEAAGAFLRDQPLSDRVRYNAELAFEEVVSNVIRYGGAREPIRVTLETVDGAVTLTIEDDGKAFDPTSAPLPEIPDSPAEARVGGFGLHMVRRAVEAMAYERDGDRNRLRLRIGGGGR